MSAVAKKDINITSISREEQVTKVLNTLESIRRPGIHFPNGDVEQILFEGQGIISALGKSLYKGKIRIYIARGLVEHDSEETLLKQPKDIFPYGDEITLSFAKYFFPTGYDKHAYSIFPVEYGYYDNSKTLHIDGKLFPKINSTSVLLLTDGVVRGHAHNLTWFKLTNLETDIYGVLVPYYYIIDHKIIHGAMSDSAILDQLNKGVQKYWKLLGTEHHR